MNLEILTNLNYVAGASVKNLQDNNKGKEYTKKLYHLISESTTFQDYNQDLVLL